MLVLVQVTAVSGNLVNVKKTEQDVNWLPCIHARTHACTYVRKHARTHACTYVRTNARTYTAQGFACELGCETGSSIFSLRPCHKVVLN